MASFKWAGGLTGGTVDDLDGITGMATGDCALVVTGGNVYTYKYDDANIAITNSPDIIEPVVGAGAWILQKLFIGALLLDQVTVDPAAPATYDSWIRTDTHEMCIKTATGTLRFEAFNYVVD